MFDSIWYFTLFYPCKLKECEEELVPWDLWNHSDYGVCFFIDINFLRAFYYIHCQTEFKVLQSAGKQMLSQSFISLNWVNRQHRFASQKHSSAKCLTNVSVLVLVASAKKYLIYSQSVLQTWKRKPCYINVTIISVCSVNSYFFRMAQTWTTVCLLYDDW